jgi:hypothetical protein
MSDFNHRPMGALLDLKGAPSIKELNPAPGEYLLLPGAPVDSPPVNNPSTFAAVIDSGVLSDHPQLKGWIVEEVDFTGSGVQDEVGHGTLVALILVSALAQGSGSIGVLSAKVARTYRRVDQGHVIQAIHWAVEKGAKSINLSLEFTGTYEGNRGLCDAIAAHPEVIFSVAAGNSGPDVSFFPAACGCTNVVTVGAEDARGEARSYSGKGDVYAPDGHRLVPESHLRYEQAQEAIEAGRREEARAHYEHAAAHGKLPEAHFQLALMDVHDGSLASALDHLDRSLELRPEFPEAIQTIGAIWALRGDPERAEPFYERSIALDPNSAMAFHNLGAARLELGRAELALEAFERAAEIDPNYPQIEERIASAKAAMDGDS